MQERGRLGYAFFMPFFLFIYFYFFYYFPPVLLSVALSTELLFPFLGGGERRCWARWRLVLLMSHLQIGIKGSVYRQQPLGVRALHRAGCGGWGSAIGKQF